MEYILSQLRYCNGNNGYIRRNAFIQIFIASVAFVLLLRVFVPGEVQHHSYSEQTAYKKIQMQQEQYRFGASDKKLQTVSFARSHVEKIILYMDCIIDTDYIPEDSDWILQLNPNESLDIQEEEVFLFRIYDDTFSCIYEQSCNNKKISDEKRAVIACDIDVEVGKSYYYEIIVPDSPFSRYFLPTAPVNEMGLNETGTLYIDGIINNEEGLVADYVYSWKLSALEKAFLCIAIIALAFLIYLFVCTGLRLADNRISQYYGRLKGAFKCVLIILNMVFGAIGIVNAVFRNSFGTGIADRIVFFVGIIVLNIIISVIILRPEMIKKSAASEKINAPTDTMYGIWEKYIQTISFGFLFYSLCEYVNACRIHYQQTNLRRMLIFLAIALFMSIGIKELKKISNLALCIGFMIAGFLYCRHAGTDEKAAELAGLDALTVSLWGILIINVVRKKISQYKALSARPQNKKRPGGRTSPGQRYRIAYILLWIVFIMFMYVYRFEKSWVFAATLPFAFMVCMDLDKDSRVRLINCLVNGIYMGFILTSGFALLHRPYNRWIFYRYGGYFHTVASTGMFLAVVMGAAFGRIFGKRGKVTGCFWDMVMLSAAGAYAILTMSRTAMLTIGLTGASVIILSLAACRMNWEIILKKTAIAALCTLLCFPMVFSAVRIIPAIINEPVYYEPEEFALDTAIRAGTPVDSTRYMTVDRFFGLLFGRLGAGEDSSSLGYTDKNLGESIYIADNVNNGNNGNDLYVYNQKNINISVNTDTGMNNDINTEGGENRRETLESDSEESDISNGRMYIYKTYLKELEIKGHPWISIADENGEEFGHAHNSYLQVAYNFGIIAGGIFVILNMLSFIYAIGAVRENGRENEVFLVLFALVMVFGIISLTEWAFHPCIPAGFCFLFVQPFLIQKSNA